MLQTNKYRKLLEEQKAENFILPYAFVARTLTAKLPGSWKDYKN